MKKHVIEGFLFDELTPAEQKKVIQKYHDINDDVYEVDSRDIINEHKKILEKEWGIENVEIQYTGFSSQGDGLSISGNVNVRKFLKALGYIVPDKFVDDISANLARTSHQYSHSNTVKAEVEYTGTPEEERNIIKELNEIEKMLDTFQHEQARKIYKELETVYFDLMSEENIAETLRANEYYFEKGSWRIL